MPSNPRRADYIHHLADLLASCNDGVIPEGKNIALLDIGVGANCIYPIIGQREYGWRFTGTDIDPQALSAAKMVVSMNPTLRNTLRLKQQKDPQAIFEGILAVNERYDATLCNPRSTARQKRPPPRHVASYTNWVKVRLPPSQYKTLVVKIASCGVRAEKRVLSVAWWLKARLKRRVVSGLPH